MTDTALLPLGVRALIYRSARVELDGKFDQTGSKNSFSLHEDLKLNRIAPFVPKVNSLTKELAAIDPVLADQANLGTVSMDPKITGSVQAYGLGYGIAPNLMIVGVLPVYDFQVKLNGNYQISNSLNQIAGTVRARKAQGGTNSPEKNEAVAQVLEQIPKPTGQNLMSALTQDMGYKPVGDWSGHGIGDVQFFGQYLLHAEDRYRHAVKLGQNFPTGRVDDPDNLVDIPFGKGNFSTFAQTVHDFMVWPGRVTFHTSARFDYQWASKRTFRLYADPSMPLASTKEELDYQRGHQYALTAATSVQIIKGLKFSSELERTQQFSDSVQGGKDSTYNYGILTQSTDWNSLSLTTGLSFSTVDYYLSGKFFMPMMVGIHYTQTLSAQNTESIQIAYLHFEAYF